MTDRLWKAPIVPVAKLPGLTAPPGHANVRAMGNRDNRHISNLTYAHSRSAIRRGLGGVCLALLFALMPTASTAGWPRAPAPRVVDIVRANSDPALIGKRVRIRACIGFSMSDTGPGPRNIAILYPCGSKPYSDEEAEKTVIAARPTSEGALAPLRRFDVASGIEADFSGRLTRQQLEPGDPRRYPLLEFDAVSDVKQFVK